MHGKQAGSGFLIMPVRNMIFFFFKKWVKQISTLIFAIYNFKSKRQYNDLWDKDTYLRHDKFIWLAYHFKYILSMHFTLLYLFACQSQTENWLHLFFNNEHKMKLPIKFQIPSKSEDLHLAPTLTLLPTTYSNVLSDITK